MESRADHAVILARGDSRRMGVPKGLCRLPDDPQCFLGRIVQLYRLPGLPVSIVTTGPLSSRMKTETS